MSARAIFSYKALQNGKVIDGQVEADSWDEAHIYLTGQGMIPIDIGTSIEPPPPHSGVDDQGQADDDRASAPTPIHNQTNTEFMDDLAQAGRIRKDQARMLPQSGPATAEQRDEAIVYIRDWMKRRRVTIKSLSKRLGKGYSTATISQVLAGAYEGDIDEKLRKIVAMVEQTNEADRVVRPEQLIETAGVKRMMSCIKETAKRGGCMGAIIAPAGCSKTTVFEAALGLIGGSVLVRVDSASRQPVGFARQILIAANERPRVYRMTYLMERLREIFADSGRLILVDEAHNLPSKGFDLLRDLIDYGCSVVVGGTSDINLRINDTAAGSQIYSRCHMIVDITADMLSPAGKRRPRPQVTVEEVIRICEGDQLRFTGDAADLLFQIANAPGLGCLRTCQLLVSIVASAQKDKRQAIDARTLMKAMREIKGALFHRFAEQEIDRRSDQMKRRVG